VFGLDERVVVVNDRGHVSLSIVYSATSAADILTYHPAGTL
jgi:hypothetical protein